MLKLAAGVQRARRLSRVRQPPRASAYATAAQGARAGSQGAPHAAAPVQEKPITIGVGEPFTTTLTVSAYFALLFTLPVLIYQGYAFVIPALNPRRAPGGACR